MKTVFERIVRPMDVEVEDGGQSVIIEFSDDAKEDGMFVRVQSHNAAGKHEKIEELIGKRVRVTVEVIGTKVR